MQFRTVTVRAAQLLYETKPVHTYRSMCAAVGPMRVCDIIIVTIIGIRVRMYACGAFSPPMAA